MNYVIMLVISLLSMFVYLSYLCFMLTLTGHSGQFYLPVLIKQYDSNSRFRRTYTELSVLARDRVREIVIRLRVKFSEISTGLDALHLFNVLTFCRAISIFCMYFSCPRVMILQLRGVIEDVHTLQEMHVNAIPAICLPGVFLAF